MNKLPESFVSKGLELSKDALIFGIPLSELTHDELLATCAQGWNSYTNSLESNIRNMEIMRLALDTH